MIKHGHPMPQDCFPRGGAPEKSENAQKVHPVVRPSREGWDTQVL
jgi:hypothetical protein